MIGCLLAAALALFVLAPASNASAQLLAAKDGPIVYGHHHLNVTSIDEHKKFWVDALGGVATQIGTNNTEIIKFPNALMFMRVQKPTGGTKGSTLDHIAFSVTNLRQVVDRIKAGGFRMVTAAEAPPNITVKDDIGAVDAGGVSGIAYALGSRRCEGGAGGDQGPVGADRCRTISISSGRRKRCRRGT